MSADGSAVIPPQPSSARRTIVVNTPIRDLSVYRALATMVARLKKHGRVEMNISALAEKSRHEMPEGGSPWHEYASLNPTPAKFFPDAMLAPFLPESFVARNRKLLLDKAEILREMGLGAAFWSYEPNFLPEAFFAAHPTLRGPRTDHPRRSLAEEFAPCVDAPETREMTSRMVQQLASEVPELGTYFFKTNDAGPGLCWSDWQYSGANGPRDCRHRSMGQRVRGLVESIQQGARRAGREISVHMTGNFSQDEIQSIRAHLPDDAHLREAGGGSINISSCADLCYPARGILDVVGTLWSLQAIKGRHVRTVFLDLRTFYDRAYERLDTSEKLIETVDDFLADPKFGTVAVYEKARAMCAKWVGDERADELFEVMVELHEAIKYKRAALPRMNTIYGAVSLRYINRPLVVLPDRLSGDEEAYFLPHVFNVSSERARLDYIDIHGTRLNPEWVSLDAEDPRVWAADTLRSRLIGIAKRFEKFGDAPEAATWVQMAGAIRLYANMLRSCANFFAMQIIRDRHAARFSGGPVDVPLRASLQGHPDLAIANEIMRDELDNAIETISLLKQHGLDILSHAELPADEDTFLLGPDIVQQIERKCEVMRAHWLDAERYLATPNK